MGAKPLVTGRPYLFKAHTREVGASVMEIRHREDIQTGMELASETLHLNEIGVVRLTTTQSLAFMPYHMNRTLGGFILIDMLTFETVAAGMISFALRRASNVCTQELDVSHTERAGLKLQTPRCIWFTGLSASGKSTLANRLDRRLHDAGRHTYLLDGDNVRVGLNRDLGFTDADRNENIRRVAEVAKLMVDAGLIVLVAFISPFRAERLLARNLFAEGEFIEVFVDTPLAECESRDPKGLYSKARSGALQNFTGIDSPYEAPESPEIHVRTMGRSIDDCLEEIHARLR